MVFFIVGIVLAVVLFVAVESGAIMGLVAAATNRHLERCERCHHYGLTHQRLVHPSGCPVAPIHHVQRPHPLHALAVVHERHQRPRS